eukprot:PhF_6_TR7960/c0_g1_i1/m.12058
MFPLITIILFALLAVDNVSALQRPKVHLLGDLFTSSATSNHQHSFASLSYTPKQKQHYYVTFHDEAMSQASEVLRECFENDGAGFIPDTTFLIYTSHEYVSRCWSLYPRNSNVMYDIVEMKHYHKYDTRDDASSWNPHNMSTELIFVLSHASDGEAVKSYACDGREAVYTCKMVQRMRLRVRSVNASAAYEVFLRAVGHPAVQWVSQYRPMHPFNENAQWITQSNVLNQRPVWAKGIQGKDVIVAVGDTGLDVGSCFFSDSNEAVSYYPSFSSTHRKIRSIVPSDCECTERGAVKAGAPATSGDRTDESHGHGTHVAGSVAGSGPSKRYQGMAPDARLVFMDLQDPSLSTASLRALYAGYKLDEKYFPRAKGLGSVIHTNSWGTNAALGNEVDGVNGAGVSKPTSYDLYCVDTDTFLWNNMDYTVLFAAGNDGARGARTVAMPANSKNVITVGALWKSDDASVRDDVAFFSSTGPTFDTRIKPDVVAPGNDIVSASSDGSGSNTECEAVEKQSGTSMATPITAGNTALLYQYLRDGWHSRGVYDLSSGITPTSALLKGMLIASTIEMNGVKKRDFSDPVGTQLNLTRPNYNNGFGVIKMDEVMLFDKPNEGSRTRDVWFSYDKVITNKTKSFSWCFAVTNSLSNLKVVLTWTDYPGALQTSKALVTNLDLLVYNSVGTTRRGNQDLYSTYTFDSNNNVEFVEFKNPIPGQYRVYVAFNGDLTPAVMNSKYGGQPFSLVIAGPIGSVSTTDNCPDQLCPSSCVGNGLCRKATVGRECQCSATNSHIDCSAVCTSSSQCSGNGCYINGTCYCYQDDARGYWSGTSCGTCDSDHTGNTCQVRRDCSSKGNLRSTTPASCQCSSSFETGFWGGSSCQECASGWYGYGCRCSTSNCNGHGTCTTQGCSCSDDSITGHWTRTVGTSCTACASPWHGSSCLCSSNCSFHGVCQATGCKCYDDDVNGHFKLSNFTCTECKDGWTGEGCLCKLEGEVVCGGHGTCVAAGCQCSQLPTTGWWRNTTIGSCDVCASYAFGTSCKCLAADCSGHGTCTADGCVCEGSLERGYWAVSAGTCKKCKDGWYGTGCLCTSADCDGHGTCTATGCQCYQNATSVDPKTRGYFQGTTTCTQCSAGWTIYPSCLCASPDCNGHGSCSLDGCTCNNDTVNGFWKPTPGKTGCSGCIDGYFGDDCTCGPTNCARLGSSFLWTELLREGTPAPQQGNTTSAPTNVHTVGFEDGTHFTVSATKTQSALVSGSTTPPPAFDLKFVMVKRLDNDHPGKTTPGGLRYLGTSFRVATQSSIQKTTSSQRTLMQTTTTNASNWIDFSSMALVFTVSPNPGLTANIVDESVKLLFLHPVDGWQQARLTCGPTDRYEVYDAATLQLTTKICGMVPGTILFAIGGSVVVPDFTQYFIIGGVLGGAVIVGVIIGLVVRFRGIIAEERRQKEAKELVLRFMTEHKKEGKTLRQQLKMKGSEKFTCEVAANRFVGALKKRRAIVERLLEQPKYKHITELAKALEQDGIPPDASSPTDGSEALGQLAQHPVKAVWEFREHEMHLWEACRKARGMFTRDPFSKEFMLQPGAMDEVRQKIVELTMENTKLKKMLQAERYKQMKQQQQGIVI